MDEVFGNENFIGQISFRKTGAFEASFLGQTSDYLLWYGREKNQTVSIEICIDQKHLKKAAVFTTIWVETSDGIRRSISGSEKRDPVLLIQFKIVFKVSAFLGRSGKQSI